MQSERVSEAVIRRLPRYYRHLLQLKADGVERISSGSLAQQMRLNASQVRQDFNCFGGFGQQGYGYKVDVLLAEIKNILSLNGKYKVVIVGAGNIGQALAHFEGFEKDGFSVVALFDVDEKLVGQEINGKPVLHVDKLDAYIRENGADIGVIAARRSAAQEIADRMAQAGIGGIWNFAPVDVVASVPVEQVHMSDSIICLSYKMAHKETAE
ncbi:MAG TPA: redox-sensing transcriptional repressor Rex [Clostridia bacterium]|jgi:redox-sensing transcriptional repressor|nr:redox-sensing transcriptional repressor Rex [Clostridia bacterium]